MRISVIIVTRNRINELKRCISALIQNTVKPHEILIIDNNSVDSIQAETLQISKNYKKYNMRYFKENKIGISYARNKGLLMAQGDIIAFTDDDCVVKKNWIKNIMFAHTMYPEAIAIGGNTLNYDNTLVGYAGHIYRQFLTVNDFMVKARLSDYRKELNKNHYMVSLSTQNISYKRKYIRQIKFTEHAAPCEAVDFSWKLLNISNNSILFIPEIIVFHEYRQKVIDFLKQNYEYGCAARYVRKLSTEAGYFPHKYLTPYLKKIIFYILFVLQESIVSEFNIFQKITLFTLLILREVFFMIGYVSSQCIKKSGFQK